MTERLRYCLYCLDCDNHVSCDITARMTIELDMADATFVAEYIANGGNGTDAAQKAWPLLTRPSAADKAHKKLRNEEIVAALMGEKVKTLKRSRYCATRLLNRLVDEAEADIQQIQDENGEFLPVKQWPMIFRTGLVSEITTDPVTGRVTKVKLDRNKRLELLGRHVDVAAWEKDKGVPSQINVTITEKDAKL